jgi:hypothetical protein
MRIDRRLAEHIVTPQNVTVCGVKLHLRFFRDANVPQLICERPVIAVGQTLYIDAQDLASIAHDVQPVAIDHRAGAYPATPLVEKVRPVQLLWKAGDGQLPEQLAVFWSRHISRPPPVRLAA